LLRALSECAQAALRSVACAAVPQELANLAWAFATVRCADSPLLSLLARSFEEEGCSGRGPGALRPQHLSNMVWSVAKLQFCDQRLINVIAAQTQ